MSSTCIGEIVGGGINYFLKKKKKWNQPDQIIYKKQEPYI